MTQDRNDDDRTTEPPLDEEIPNSAVREAEDARKDRAVRGSSDLYGQPQRVVRRERALQQEREMRHNPKGRAAAPDTPGSAAADTAGHKDSTAANTAATAAHMGSAGANTAGTAVDTARTEAPERPSGERTAAAVPPPPPTPPAQEPGQKGGRHPAGEGRLIPENESDALGRRLQGALSHFVDDPGRSVEEAASVLEEAAQRLSTALAERPLALRAAWEGGAADGTEGGGDTETLRLALRNYRETTERLLQI